MRRLVVIGAIVATAAVLCSCTARAPMTSSTPKPAPTRAIPTSWEDVADNGVVLYSWTAAADGTVTGADESTAAHSNWNVKTTSVPLTGRIADGTITLTVGGTAALGGGATFTGTISPFTLSLSGVADDGTPQTWTFFPSTQPIYQRDVGTFTSKAQKALQAAQIQQAQDALDQAVATFRSTVTALQAALTAQAAAVTAEHAAMAKLTRAVSAAKATGCNGGSTGKAAEEGYTAVNDAFANLGSADAAIEGAAADEATARRASAFDTDGLDIGPELDAGDKLAVTANQLVSDTQRSLDSAAVTQGNLYASVTTMPGC